MTILVAVIWILLCAPLAMLSILDADANIRLNYSLAAQIVAPTAAAFCCYITSNIFPADDAMRKVWRFLGVGLLCWGIGAILFAVYPLLYAGQETPYPWYSDIGYLALAPFILIAFFIFKQHLHIQAPLWGLAGSIVLFLVALALSIAFNLNKINAPDSALSYAVTLLYTIADPLLLGATIIIASILSGGVIARPWWLVLIGLILYYLSDLSYTYMVLQEEYTTGNLIDMGWLLGFGCIAVAALMTHSLFKDFDGF